MRTTYVKLVLQSGDEFMWYNCIQIYKYFNYIQIFSIVLYSCRGTTVKRHASVMSMHVLYYSLWRSPGESTTRTVCKIYKSIREKDLPLCNHTYILVLFVPQRSICLKYEVQPCTRVLRWRCTRVLVLIWSGMMIHTVPSQRIPL